MITYFTKRLVFISLSLMLPLLLIKTITTQASLVMVTTPNDFPDPYLLDINPGANSSAPITSFPVGHSFFVNRDEMYLNARDDVNGSEFWMSDGTISGTKVISDFNPGLADTEILDGEFIDNKLYFVASQGLSYDLWQTNGSFSETELIRSFSGTNPNSLTNVDGTLFFRFGGTLWKSDGTEIGTQQIPAGIGSVLYLTAWNGNLFFRASDGGNGTELWKSDGTVTGTILVKDIHPDNSSFPSNFTNFNERLFFVATDPVYGQEIWVTDGSEEGTTIFKDVNPTGDSSPSYLTVVNDLLFFTANDGINGFELWVSDGTEDGTRLVKNINVSGDSNPIRSVSGNGILYFMADDGIHGEELWVSDGTEAGTYLVKDINPTGSSTTMYQTTHEGANGLFFISLDDGIHGVELWVSDGTADGTHIVADINPNGDSFSSYTTSPVYMNGTLYFPANDGTHGIEVWALDIGPKAVDVDPQNPTKQSIISYDGKITVNMPSGSLPSNASKLLYDTNIELIDALPQQFADIAFSLKLLDSNWIEIENPEFTPPFTIEIKYIPAQIPAISGEDEILVLFFNETTNVWDQVPVIERNLEQNIITVEVSHFTNFALVTPNKLFIPLVMRN